MLAVAQAPAPASTVATVLVEALRRLGVAQAFGVMGGAIAPFFHAIAHSDISTLHLRHEAGAAFAAIEASLASRRPTLIFTTAGPGITNALTGMLAARAEGAHVIFVSAASSAAHRFRVATQETGPRIVETDALHLSATLEHPAQLAPLIARLAAGLARPNGFVAHLALPIDLQRAPCAEVGPLATLQPPQCSAELIARHAALFADDAPIWLGWGARHAAGAIRQLVERLGARVMCSPRAKGIVPEDHPRFLGVTGLGGHTRVDECLVADRPARTLVLGTRMGESTSFWAPELTPRDGFVHVDVDATAFGAAYPGTRTEGVLAEIGCYVEALLAELGPRAIVTINDDPEPVPRPSAREGAVRPQLLLDGLQRVIVDGSDAWLMAESGNAFCWSTHYLRYREPGRYRVSTQFGSMGHAATGVVGAALARTGKAFALVGDGAMMMLNELHSAVQYKADAVWVILNDACYLMCAQGMRMMGWEPFHCELPRVDFVALARAIGADGERLERESEIEAALARALAARGPWVLDVAIDPREAPPSGRRNKSLMQQGAQ